MRSRDDIAGVVFGESYANKDCIAPLFLEVLLDIRDLLAQAPTVGTSGPDAEVIDSGSNENTPKAES